MKKRSGLLISFNLYKCLETTTEFSCSLLPPYLEQTTPWSSKGTGIDRIRFFDGGQRQYLPPVTVQFDRPGPWTIQTYIGRISASSKTSCTIMTKSKR
jgi:hypothetical protein